MNAALLGPAPPPTIAGGAPAAGWVALANGRPKEALREGNRALGIIDPGSVDLGWARLLLAWTATRLGDRDGAAREAGAAFEEFCAAADTEGTGRSLVAIGWLAVNGGRLDEGATALARALEHLAAAPDAVLNTAIVAVADLADAMGDPASAQRLRSPDSPAPDLADLARARCGVA